MLAHEAHSQTSCSIDDITADGGQGLSVMYTCAPTNSVRLPSLLSNSATGIFWIVDRGNQ
jgi:hypothetical protein